MARLLQLTLFCSNLIGKFKINGIMSRKITKFVGVNLDLLINFKFKTDCISAKTTYKGMNKQVLYHYQKRREILHPSQVLKYLNVLK